MEVKDYCQASENNKRPIWDALKKHLSKTAKVLELGSGAGQHAIFFTEQNPLLDWQCSELTEKLPALNDNLSRHTPALLAPLCLDVSQAHTWPKQHYDLIYSANTLHIMSWASVCELFADLANHLTASGEVAFYGPFNERGQFTTESNRHFDSYLKQQNRLSGIRCKEALRVLANQYGLKLSLSIAMPANNQLLFFSRS